MGDLSALQESHSPQPPGAFGLVDVDEVGHHAALQEAALSLHPDLKHKQSSFIKSQPTTEPLTLQELIKWQV